MKIRSLIVDDERLARDRLRSLALGEPDLELVGECGDGVEALATIEELRPDLLFLDVQMPRLDGFGVIAALPPGALPAVIFTTAHDQHAVRAFEVHALDYLLKPFKEARFRLAVARARARLSEKRQPATDGLQSLAVQLRAAQFGGPHILVKSPDRIVFLRAAEIDWVEAAGNYVVLHAGSERHIMRETMSALEKRLEEAGFMRVSRSAILNLQRVRELKPAEAGQFCVVLKSGARLGITCSLRELQDRMAGL
jgi:two-component system, LytTR family, response regulator